MTERIEILIKVKALVHSRNVTIDEVRGGSMRLTLNYFGH